MIDEDVVKKFVEFLEFPDNDVEFDGAKFTVKCRKFYGVIQEGIDELALPYNIFLFLAEVFFPKDSEFKVIYTFVHRNLDE